MKSKNYEIKNLAEIKKIAEFKMFRKFLRKYTTDLKKKKKD